MGNMIDGFFKSSDKVVIIYSQEAQAHQLVQVDPV